MRRFLASAWFPVASAFMLAIGSVMSYGLLFRKLPVQVSNSDLLLAGDITGWAVGPVAAILSIILACILNGIRRLLRLRRNAAGHVIVVLLIIAPWAIFAWQMVMKEPRHTEIAKAVIDFGGKPLFIGSAVALLFIILVSLLALAIPSRTPKK